MCVATCTREVSWCTGIRARVGCVAPAAATFAPTDEQQALISQFANRDIVEANERVVLLSPFTPGDSTNRWSSPQLDGDVQAMW